MSTDDNQRTPLESALRGLAPVAPRLDRDALMFAAGRASASRRRWAWPALAGLFALISLGLGVRLATISPVGQPGMPTPPTNAPAVPKDLPKDDESPGLRMGDLARTLDNGELPDAHYPHAAVLGAAKPPFQPMLERDLDMPPGGLDDLSQRLLATPNP